MLKPHQQPPEGISMSMQVIKDAEHLEELIGEQLPRHLAAEERRDVCERMVFLLRNPEANPLRGLVPSDMGALGCARD